MAEPLKDRFLTKASLGTFADMSTRRHYPGIHHISIIVNGEIKAGADFKLK